MKDVKDRNARGTERILLVEDDPAVRAVAQRGLTRFGYEVLAASSGEEAIRVADATTSPIHLVLTDIMMPGMNGVEVGRELLRRRPGIKVFYMSGYADKDLIRQGLLEPGTIFLQKPFSPKELAERIRHVLDGDAPSSISSVDGDGGPDGGDGR